MYFTGQIFGLDYAIALFVCLFVCLFSAACKTMSNFRSFLFFVINGSFRM